MISLFPYIVDSWGVGFAGQVRPTTKCQMVTVPKSCMSSVLIAIVSLLQSLMPDGERATMHCNGHTAGSSAERQKPIPPVHPLDRCH